MMGRTVRRPLVIGVVALAALAGLGAIVAITLMPGAAPASSPPVAQVSIAPATPTPTATPTATPSPTPTPAPTPIGILAPLTGEPVSEEAAVRHPIAVMIDDHADARPQSGLNSADIVWHAPAEGGIPRYMAIFQSKVPKAVGPVRSAREYFIAWASEWRAVYAHAGGSQQALALLRSKGNGEYVYNADQFRFGSQYFRRISSRQAPHNLYTDGQALRSLGDVLKAKDGPLEPFAAFAPDAAEATRPYGGSINVRYSSNDVTYRYDHATNTYLRSVSREGKQTDAADDERVAPKNVIVLVVRFSPVPRSKLLDADLIGSGTAYISTNGRTVQGTWKKTGTTEPTRFFDKAGAPVTLTVGQTFLQVVRTGSPVNIKAGSGTW